MYVTDGNVVVVHDRCSRMSQGVKPERFDLCLIAEGLDRFSSVKERPGVGPSCLASSIGVIEDPGDQESPGPSSQYVSGVVPAAPKRSQEGGERGLTTVTSSGAMVSFLQIQADGLKFDGIEALLASLFTDS